MIINKATIFKDIYISTIETQLHLFVKISQFIYKYNKINLTSTNAF